MEVLQRLWVSVHDVLPKSSYSTSVRGLTFKQVLNSPLPPYLSPLPVIFRVLAYMTIAPVVILLILDIGGYFVWRLYDQPFWSGTRTAFYKFKTSPVFVRSGLTSPEHTLKPFDFGTNPSGPTPASPEGRDASLSPVSSSASLHELHMTSDPDTNPPSPVVYMNDRSLNSLSRGPAMEPLTNKFAKEVSSATSMDKREDRTESTPTPAMYPVKPIDGLGLDVSTPSGSASPGLNSLGSTSSSNGEDDDAAFSEAKLAVNVKN